MDHAQTTGSHAPSHALHVWRATTSRAPDLATDGRRLDIDDLARAARIREPRARARFINARIALRDILARYTGVPPAELTFSYSPSGKPLLAATGVPGFSLSHTADLVLVAVWPAGAVGIDAERVRDVIRQARIERRLFPAQVVRRLSGLPAEERRLAFFHAWTQREAYVKAIGGTLFRTEDPLPLLWPPDSSPQRIRLGGDADAHGRAWTVCTMRPAAGYVASVVAEGAVGHVEIRVYPDDLERFDTEPDEPA